MAQALVDDCSSTLEFGFYYEEGKTLLLVFFFQCLVLFIKLVPCDLYLGNEAHICFLLDFDIQLKLLSFLLLLLCRTQLMLQSIIEELEIFLSCLCDCSQLFLSCL